MLIYSICVCIWVDKLHIHPGGFNSNPHPPSHHLSLWVEEGACLSIVHWPVQCGAFLRICITFINGKEGFLCINLCLITAITSFVCLRFMMVVLWLKVVQWKMFTLIIEDTFAHDFLVAKPLLGLFVVSATNDFNACVLQIV